MRPVLLLLVLLAVPAAAAGSVPVSGDLSLPMGLRLEGRLEARATRALLDLADLAEANDTLLSWEGATGYLVEKTGTYATPLGDVTADREDRPSNRSLALGPGRLRGLECHSDCFVVLFTEGEPGSTLGAGASMDGPLRWLRAPEAFGAGFPEEGARDSFYLEASPGWVEVAAREPDLGPRLGLFLWNVSGRIQTEEGTLPFRTGPERRPVAAPLGGAAEEIVTRHLVLHLDRPALLALAPGARLLADAPSLLVDGSLDAPRAEGSLRVEGRAVRLAGESLRVEGAFELRPRGKSGSLPALDVRDPFSGAAPAARVEGDATLVRIGGAALAQPDPLDEKAGLALGALLLLALAGALWHLKSILLAPFYVRVDPRRVLENPNRARIHRLVSGTPGLSAADLSRATGMARAVVDHHLRMLVAHGCLVARGGRARIAYFPAARAPDAAAHARTDALRDDTRRKVARTLLEEPGASQKEIAARAGLRQRLVSHHLRRLLDEGLARREGSMPARYHPEPALRGALDGGLRA